MLPRVADDNRCAGYSEISDVAFASAGPGYAEIGDITVATNKFSDADGGYIDMKGVDAIHRLEGGAESNSDDEMEI